MLADDLTDEDDEDEDMDEEEYIYDEYPSEHRPWILSHRVCPAADPSQTKPRLQLCLLGWAGIPSSLSREVIPTTVIASATQASAVPSHPSCSTAQEIP